MEKPIVDMVRLASFCVSDSPEPAEQERIRHNRSLVGLMYLHAARHALTVALDGAFSERTARKCLPVLPYRVEADGEVLNRRYAPLNSEEKDADRQDDFPQLRIPVCKIKDAGYLFDDACSPWRDRLSAQRYLERLEGMIDFDLDDLGGAA